MSGPAERKAQGPSGPAERKAQGPSGPAERKAQGPSGPAERKAQGTSGPAEREAQGPPRLVLVVDDDQMIRRLLRVVLEADEIEVVEASDGDAALAVLEDLKPTVIVLDVMMPGLDGVEVCRRIDHQTAKVVMLTARDDPELEMAATKAGADAFLTKPFSAVELLDLVERLLQVSPSG